jgi:HEAT repeat protein
MAASGPVLPHAFVVELIGAEEPEHARFTEQVLGALGKISPELAPSLYQHPFGDLVIEGVSAFGRLVEISKSAGNDVEGAAAIDAIAEIIQRRYATKEVVLELQKLLSEAKSEVVASVAARALAVAGDEGFLEQQRNLLASSSPSEVRVAAKLCGFGKYKAAVPALLDLLRDDQMAISDVVIWALGEIGDPSALPKLHRLLSSQLRTEHVLSAIGKIGDATSAVRLLPVLVEGAKAQREKAAQAMVGILRKNDGQLFDPSLEQLVKVALERALDQDESRLVRFHAIVAYSLLGGHLEPKRILASLGGALDAQDLDAMNAFFTVAPKKKSVPPPWAKKSPPKGRKPI